MSWRVTLPCTRAQGEAVGALEAVAGFDEGAPVLVADEPDPDRPDEWLIHAYFEHRPTAKETAILAALGIGAPQLEELGEDRLGDDEPGWPSAAPRGPLPRPHTDPQARPRGGQFRNRRRPRVRHRPARNDRRLPRLSSMLWRATAGASRISPTSAPAPDCSPSPRWRCGRRQSASRPTSTRSRSTSRATMPRSTASLLDMAPANCCWRSPTGWTRRCSPRARRSTC